jgi:hypothetical protein
MELESIVGRIIPTIALEYFRFRRLASLGWAKKAALSLYRGMHWESVNRASDKAGIIAHHDLHASNVLQCVP